MEACYRGFLMDAMTADKVELWARRARYLLIFLVAGLIISLLLIFRSYWNEKKASEAYAALYAAQVVEESVAKNRAEAADEALGGAALMALADSQEQQAYMTALRQVLDEHPRSTAAAAAGLKLARWEMEQQRLDEALALLNNVNSQFKRPKNTQLYRALALDLIALITEQKGEAETAIPALEDYLGQGKDSVPMRDHLRMALAKAYALSGEKARAIANFEILANDEKSGPYGQRARVAAASLRDGGLLETEGERNE